MKIKIKKFVFAFAVLGALTMGCESDSTSPSQPTINSGSGGVGQGGSLARFTIAGNYLYVVTNNALFTYSILNKTNPELVSKVNLWAFTETIFTMDNYLFLGTRNGVEIFNISNPLEPVFTSRYSHIESCDPVVARGNYVYSTLRTGTSCNRGTNRLDVIDISDISFPRQVNSLVMENPKGLALWNDFLFVCDNSNIKTFFMKNPTNPNQIASTQLDDCFDLIATGNNLIAVSGLGVTQFKINGDGSLSKLSFININ